MVNKIWGAEVAPLPPDFSLVKESILKFLQLPDSKLFFKFPLLDIQKKAVAHMAGLRYSCLFDDMGLGKTVQALALTTITRSEKTLIFCPNNIKKVWQAEIANFTLFGPADIYTGKGDDLLVLPETLINRFSYFIFNYETLRVAGKTGNIFPAIFELADHIILDEAHHFRNSLTQDFMSFFKFLIKKAPNFLTILTGTPIDRFLGEAWSYLALLDLNPAVKGTILRDFFPSQEYFNERYAILKSASQAKGKKWGDYRKDTYPEVKQMFGARVVRREVGDIDTLPPLKELDVNLPDTYFPGLDWGQVTLSFQKAHKVTEMVNRRKRPGEKEMETLQIMQKLRVDMALKKAWYTFTQAQWMLRKGQVVLFSEFISPLKHIKQLASSKGIDSLLVYGQGMKLADRDKNISDFKKGEAPLLLATFGAMSEGENLQCCQQILFNDLPWQVLVAQQAQRRVWRIGQDKPCTHVRMLCGGDEFILNVIFKKSQLVSKLYADFKQIKEEYHLGNDKKKDKSKLA